MVSRLALALCAITVHSLAARAIAAPVFADRAPELGIAHSYEGGWEHFVGGGVAVFDCNADGRPDLLAAGGTHPAALFVNATAGPGEPLRFVEATPPELALTGVTGAYPLEIDGDGESDLVLLRVGENRVFAGNPDCRFRDLGAELGLDGGSGWTTAFSATWEAGRDLPTLAFGNYVDREDPDGPFGTCDDNLLYRPEGGRYGDPVTLLPGHCPLSMLFSDWARRGVQDLRISNDRHYYLRGGGEQLWRMDAVPRLYTEAEGWEGPQLWGMGIASRDITGDGHPEVYLTSMGDQWLMRHAGDPSRPDWSIVPFETGAAAHRPYAGDDGRPSTGWHAQFGDVNNDGRDDLFVAKGNVDQMPENASADPNNLLLQRSDGRFEEAGGVAGIGSTHRARGAALADLDGDGRLDLVVVNRRTPIEIYQNLTGDAGNWLAVELQQEGRNPDVIGSWIELRGAGQTSLRELTVGGGHAGGQRLPEHFGLGDLERVELRAITPDGRASDWIETGANRTLRLLLDDGGLTIRP